MKTKTSSENKHSLDDLNRLYSDGEGVDQEIFAEMRSNVLLYSGEHYNRRNSSFYKRIRDSKDLSSEQKLRLTKNHTQFICDTYVNNIVAPNPGVGFSAKNEKEVHDQKVAEIHHSVWRDAHEKYVVDDLIDDWADSFVQIGEVAVKIFFDPNKGMVKAYGQKTDEEGNPLFYHPYRGEVKDQADEMGQPLSPAPDENNPIRWGEFDFEEVYGFNLIRPAECKNMKKAPWLGIRKMVDKKELQKRFPDHEKKITETQDRTFIIFDTARGGYTKTDNQTMVIEYFFRPCHEYPNGYFYITTQDLILAEGELPGGIFPIVWGAFRKFPTTPRGRSPIKTMRPYQAEINRSASKMAEHQITLGDDKLLIQNGTKISAGIALPGVRSINFTGQDPKILGGRDGAQYLNYMNGQITELYQVMGVKEDTEELPAQLDPYVMLFRSARQKKRFQRYIKRFEKFLIEIVKVYLSLAKIHLTDDYFIQAVGATEAVNIAEFRKMKDLCYEIKVEAQSEDVETKLGKQIALNHALQYVGNRLSPMEIGKIMRSMPYTNLDESFDDLTIDYDNSVNDILALDRGETPPVNQYDKHPYCISRLVARMRKSDFKMLPPQVQQNYANKVRLHEQFEAQRQIALQRAQQGMIPTGGYMVKCDLYVPGKNPDSAPKRVTIPSESIQWLMSQMEGQMAGLAPIMELNPGAQEEIANQFTQMGGAPAGGANNQPPSQGMINQAARFPATAMS